MKFLIGLMLAFTTLFACSTTTGWDPNAENDALAAITTFKKTDPKLNQFFTKAYGYVVYPNVAKGAMGIGGAYGSGTVFQQGKVIGASKLTQVTIGFQLGGQAYSEIIFFRDKAAMKHFKEGNFELGAQVSAVAVTAGASANVDYSGGVAVFTMTRGGLMYEASIGGQSLSFEAR